ncbi:uncharacterized protein BXZ73DRAFT_47815 [Epithele typhae]|nr:uncharacterized protein BXZ73DRAFT_47815 [Epithele typhae]KAH9929882.1 hypothetical protein BXZ73DRAFT_47815 [Epithele typhae]
MWFRGYHRRARWSEELKALDLEMHCTVLSFSGHQRDWKERAKATKHLPGHTCYANGQAAMWQQLVDESAAIFHQARDKYRDPSIM